MSGTGWAVSVLGHGRALLPEQLVLSRALCALSPGWDLPVGQRPMWPALLCRQAQPREAWDADDLHVAGPSHPRAVAHSSRAIGDRQASMEEAKGTQAEILSLHPSDSLERKGEGELASPAFPSI